jgi:hypothetical protein
MYTQAVARQNDAVAFRIFDDTVYRELAVRPGGNGTRASDTFFESQALGTPAATASSLDDLAEAMQPYGLHASTFLTTLTACNEAIAAGAAAYLPIPRR